MRKIFGYLIGIIFLFFFFNLQAANAVSFKYSFNPQVVYKNSPKLTITFEAIGEDYFRSDQKYSLGVYEPNKSTSSDPNSTYRGLFKDKRTLSVDIPPAGLFKEGDWNFKLWLGEWTFFRKLTDKDLITQGSYHVFQPSNISGAGLPALAMDNNVFEANTSANLYVKNADPNQNYSIWFDPELIPFFNRKFSSSEIDSQKTATLSISVGPPREKRKVCMALATAIGGTINLNCDFSIEFSVISLKPTGSPTPIQSNEIGFPSAAPTAKPPEGPCKEGFCLTAFGPIDINPAGFIRSIFTILLSFAGIIAVTLIVISGYRLMTSQGNPEKVQEAREQLTSAIVGLLFIIFSLSILTIIGVDILRIPGFER